MAVERGGAEEAKAVRSGLMCAGCLPPRARVMSGPRQLPRATHVWVQGQHSHVDILTLFLKKLR